MSRHAIHSIGVLALVSALAAPAAGQETCKGTKRWYEGACRYPDEIERLKKVAAPAPCKGTKKWFQGACRYPDEIERLKKIRPDPHIPETKPDPVPEHPPPPPPVPERKPEPAPEPAPAIDCPPGAQAHGKSPPRGTLAWCEAGGVATGPRLEWFATGTLHSRQVFRDGNPTGERTEYFETGGKYLETTLRDGVWTYQEWHRSGAVAVEAEVVGGQLHGRALRWDRDGNFLFAECYRSGSLLWQSSNRATAKYKACP